MALQNVDHFKDIKYAEGITYGELLMQNEQEMSSYNLVGGILTVFIPLMVKLLGTEATSAFASTGLCRLG